MSRDSKIKWCIIAATILVDIALVASTSLYFPPQGWIRPLGFSALLVAFGIFYQRRNVPTFVLCINGLLHVVLFSSAYTVLMYAGGTFALPLIDDQLALFDRLIGFHLPAVVEWANAHAGLQRVLQFCYDTLLPQTAVVIAILGFLGDRRALQSFVLRFMICAWLTALIFFCFPAEGPFSAYAFAPSEDQTRYLVHLETLRVADRVTFPHDAAEGLITFPSFHTTWAMLIALAFWHRRGLFVPFALLNGAVVVATMTTGWHYLSDVLAGALTCAVAVVATRKLDPWLYPTPADARAENSRSPADPLPAQNPI